MTHSNKTTRRHFLGTSAVALTALPALSGAARADGHGEEMVFEITRTDAEWKEMLTEGQHYILREGGTERRFASPLTEEEGEGTYHCQGCDLTIYDSEWKTIRQIGWVFFYHSRPNAVLTSIDEWPNAMTGENGMKESRYVIEAHCRRCGSHLGHILQVQDDVLHCINGLSLEFKPTAA